MQLYRKKRFRFFFSISFNLRRTSHASNRRCRFSETISSAVAFFFIFWVRGAANFAICISAMVAAVIGNNFCVSHEI